jgi:hypothetical protein
MEVQLRITEITTPQYATSDVVRAGATAPALKLTCTSKLGENRVTRGDTITCTASKDPVDASGELADVRWAFTGMGFKYPDAEAGDEVPTGTTWKGKMVMSGTVSVKAKLNGSEQSASVSVDVQPRADFLEKRVEVAVRPGTLADVPGSARPADFPSGVRDLGRAVNMGGGMAYDPKNNLAAVLRTVGIVQDGGPNHNLAYLEEIPLDASSIVVVHPALAEGTAFHQAQARESRVVSGTPPCLQSRFGEYIRKVAEHEGIDGNPNSHVGYFEQALNPLAARAVEPLVYHSSRLAEMAREWQRLLRPIVDSALVKSGDPLDDDHPIRFGCEFNFDSRTRR